MAGRKAYFRPKVTSNGKNQTHVALTIVKLCLAEGYLLAYHSIYNVFLMDFSVSSFVLHSSLLTAKNVDLVIPHDYFL